MKREIIKGWLDKSETNSVSDQMDNEDDEDLEDLGDLSDMQSDKEEDVKEDDP